MRIVVLKVFKDFRNNELSVIPTSKSLGRMFDNNSNRLVIEFSPVQHLITPSTLVYLRFISDYLDLGEVLVKPDEFGKYMYDVSSYYTKKSNLEVQVILRGPNHEDRTNICKFTLGNSLPVPSTFDQNLSYLNRLVLGGAIKLEVDEDSQELIILDDLDNELCTIDIYDLLPNEKIGGDGYCET